MELAWVWGRFSIIRVQDKETDTKARFYPMERAGRLGYDHIYYEGDWVFLTNLDQAVDYVKLYACTPPGERNKLRPFDKTRKRGNYGSVDSNRTGDHRSVGWSGTWVS